MSYKQSKRRDDDITIVNMAMNVFFKPKSNTVQKTFLYFGGMAPVTTMAKKTCEALENE